MTTDTTLRATERGTGVPIVMIHGYTVDHRVLLPLEAAFDARPGYRRIYLDLPGHGASPRLPGPTSAIRLADAVMEAISDAVGEEPFAIVGQSFGGQIARAAIARFGAQVVGSVLLAPVVRWGAERTLPATTVLGSDDDLLDELPAPRRELFSAVMAHRDRPRWDLFQEYLLPGWDAHDRAAAAELESAFLLPAPPETLVPRHEGVHLLVLGRQDALVGWSDQLGLLSHYPRMTAAIIDGAGHNPQIEASGMVNDLVGRWLDALSS